MNEQSWQGKRVHFVGIGGSGMSPLAHMLHEAQAQVSGSDLIDSIAVQKLRVAGITVYRGHDATNLGNAQLVIASSAVPASNPELVEANKRGLVIRKRAEILGNLTRERKTIAVSGTHGKTTTAAMIALIMREAGLDASYMIGGDVPDLGGSGHWGEGEWLVTEADEFDGSFLRFSPRVAVVTSVEADHLDFYGTLDAVESAFAQFMALPPQEGSVIICSDYERIRKLAATAIAPVVTYSAQRPADWHAWDVVLNEQGSFFMLSHLGEKVGEGRLVVPGLHNVSNAVAAVAAASEAGVEPQVSLQALAGYHGSRRRFELKGRAAGVTFVDDYGHHPTEVAATLAAARTRNPRRLWCLFQPHTYHRTKSMLTEFARALEAADVVVVTDVYMPAGRERDTLGISAGDIVKHMNHPDAHYLAGLEDSAGYIYDRLRPGDLVLTMGAGDVYKAGEALLERLKRNRND